MGQAILRGQKAKGGGSSPAPIVGNSIRFLDYDGTVLHTYEVGKLTAMPPLPEQPGLICQGWNWTLEEIQDLGRAVDVGAMYITDDGKTRLYITVTSLGLGRTVHFSQDVDSGVEIDWGDGSAVATVSGTGDQSSTHVYSAPGEYRITLLPSEECTLGLGNGTDFTQAVVEAVRLNRVEIGRSVTSIGDYAFWNCNSLQSVVIPDSVTSIGYYTFWKCYPLQSVVIPNSVTSIGDYAFYDCYSLQRVVIPDSVTSIVTSAFNGCYSLQRIVIPDSVTSIGDNAFSHCNSLQSIEIPDGVTSIGDYAFQDCCSLQRVVIPDSVTSIGASAFRYCYALQSVVIPDSVTSIGYYAFQDCSSLQRVVIPDSVTSIVTSVFRYCYALRSVVIPDSVTSIAASAFYDCHSMDVYDFTVNTAVPTLGTNAFSGIRADCEIRVPAALYSQWIAAANWSTYAANIVAV